jgi:HK97 gp10 family phage protein
MAFFRGDTKSGFGLQGEREVRKLLKELGPRIERKVTRGAMKKAARPIVMAAKRNARAKLKSKRGHQLAKSIGSRQKTYTAQGVVYTAIGPRFSQGAHGHLIEFGHRVAAHGTGTLRRVHKPGGRPQQDPISKVTGQRGTGAVKGFVAAIPFLRPAYEAHKQEVLTIAIREHRARIEREAQKIRMRKSR